MWTDLKKQRKILELACIFLRVLERPRISVVSDDVESYFEAFRLMVPNHDTRLVGYTIDGKPRDLFDPTGDYVNLMVVDGLDIKVSQFDNINRRSMDMMYFCTNTLPHEMFSFTNEHKSHATQRYDWGAEYLLLKRNPTNGDPRKVFETLRQSEGA